MSVKKRILLVTLVVAVFIGGIALMTATFIGCTSSMAHLILAIQAHDVLNAWRYGFFTVFCGSVFGTMFAKLLKNALAD